MLLVGQSVDSRNLTVLRELLDIGLSKRAYHRAMNHPAKDPGRIDDRFASAELNVALRKEDDASSQFANTNFKTDSGSGRWFTEKQGPGLPIQRAVPMLCRDLP